LESLTISSRRSPLSGATERRGVHLTLYDPGVLLNHGPSCEDTFLMHAALARIAE